MENNIWSEVRRILSSSLNIDIDHIKYISNLKEDLGVDSLDIADLTFRLEKEFSISITDKEMISVSTVSDIVHLVMGKKKMVRT